jgi:chromosome segregation protein
LSRRIGEIQSLLAGIDAAQQLTSRSAEFAQVEKEFPSFLRRLKEAETFVADCKPMLKEARNKCHEYDKEQSRLDDRICREQEDIRREFTESLNQRRQQVERIVQYRTRRRPMPPSWYTRQAHAELRTQYESVESVRRDIERLKRRRAEGTWVTDPQVVEIRDKIHADYADLEKTIDGRRVVHRLHVKATDEARESYMNVLRATVRQYSRNVRSLGELAGIVVAVDSPHLINEDLALAQAGLNVKFDFDRKGMIGLNDGEASGGQQVMKSLILLIGLLMDETRTGGFVFIDEPFAHLDVFNIDKVGAFLEATRAQYVLTTPNTHNVNVFKKSDLTLVTQKRRHTEKWAPPVAFLRREKEKISQ